MTTIIYKGKERKLSFNIAAAIAYERKTGRNFFNDLTAIQEGKLEQLITIGWCMLIANNDPHDIPDFEEFTQSMEFDEETTAFINGLSAELTSYFKPEAGEKPKKGKKSKADDSKNA